MSLVLDGLVKRFGPVVALDGVSFEVAGGSVFGFLGANGAGKTTTMRIVLDIIRADSGTVAWDGVSSLHVPRETWGYLPEERGLYPRMAVMDQLVYFASLYGVPRDVAAARARDWLARLRIPDYANRRAEELSKGNQQKIQVIGAVLHEPPVLIMDEPFSALDPVNVGILKEAFAEMRERGSTLIFSTHQMEMVEEVCEAVALIDHGRLVLSGPVRDVKRATGRRVVRLGVAGDPALRWLAGLDGVRVVRPGLDFSELDVPLSMDPSTILRAALDHGETVTHFEIAEPSIEDIFIEKVGRAPSDDEHLATATTIAGASADTGARASTDAGSGAAGSAS